MGNIALGDAGEKIAADFLRAAGYKILAQKFRTKTGEIDIIAKDKNMLSFIEVKTRSSNIFGTPAQAVTYQKQQKIINTALFYLDQTGNSRLPFRFDVLEVLLPAVGPTRCNHIINAFGR